MATTEFLGKILHLARTIHVANPPQGASRTGFLAGLRFHPGVPIIDWWTTWRTEEVASALAHDLVSSEKGLAGAEESTISRLLLQTLQEATAIPTLLDARAIILHQVPNLFDAIVPADKMTFSKTIFSRWLSACIANTAEWLVVYPLERTAGPTVEVATGMWLIDGADRDWWDECRQKFAPLNDFDPLIGRVRTGLSCFVGGMSPYPFVWLGILVQSTPKGATRLAEARMRRFLAVTFCLASNTNRGIILKTLWNPSTRCFLFGSKGGSESHGIGPLMLPIGNTFQFSPQCIADVQKWYATMSKNSVERQHRIEVACDFLHQALLARGTQQFVFYFIAMDALFGERHRVEKSIEAAVIRLTGNDPAWKSKAEMLFDLRSDVLHGGISDIGDWKKLKHYRRRFHSKPSSDMQSLALMAVREAQSSLS